MLASRMRRRWLRIFLLAFHVVWFGAVVPGHQRGQIVLGGSLENPAPSRANSAVVEAKAVPSCHKSKKACAEAQTPHAPEGESREPARPSGCAVCAFASTIDCPPSAILIPRPTSSSELEQWDPPPAARVRIIPSFDARGPPVTAAKTVVVVTDGSCRRA